MCVLERERESVCVFERERGSVCMCLRDSLCLLRERESVCSRERAQFACFKLVPPCQYGGLLLEA